MDLNYLELIFLIINLFLGLFFSVIVLYSKFLKCRNQKLKNEALKINNELKEIELTIKKNKYSKKK